MNRIVLPIAVIVAVAIVAAVDFASLYARLPAQVASHFDAQGAPNGWMAKSQFLNSTLRLVAMVGSLICFVPATIWFAPASLMNLPHREYWLAPERERLARTMIVDRMLWFMAATLALLAYIVHGVLKANLPPGGRLEIWPAIGGYLTFTLLWLGEMCWAFRKPARDDAPDDRRLVA